MAIRQVENTQQGDEKFIVVIGLVWFPPMLWRTVLENSADDLPEASICVGG